MAQKIRRPDVGFVGRGMEDRLLPRPRPGKIGCGRVRKKPFRLVPVLQRRDRLLLGNPEKMPLPFLVPNEVMIVDVPGLVIDRRIVNPLEPTHREGRFSARNDIHGRKLFGGSAIVNGWFAVPRGIFRKRLRLFPL